MTGKIFKGRIIGIFKEQGSGLAMLAIDDDRRGKRLIPCEANPTARAFDEAFGGFIVGGHSTRNDAITGESIYYTVDSVGLLETFTPEGRAPIEMVDEYERTTAKEPRQAGHIGFVEPDDPRIPKAPEGGMGTCTFHGFLPDDHWLYGAGPIVSGRPLSQPHRKMTPEEREKLLADARAAVARGNQEPPKESGTVKVTVGGLLPPGHPMYSRGPMIFGRPDPKKKPTEND